MQKFTLNCNWKFTADNAFDYYHPQITHISAQAVGMIPQCRRERHRRCQDRRRQGPRCAAASHGPRHTGRARRVRARDLGSEPGLDAEDPASRDARARHLAPEPRVRSRPSARSGPGSPATRISSRPPGSRWTHRSASGCRAARASPRCGGSASRTATSRPRSKKAQLGRQIHSFGPAGFLEQEDGENWSQSTAQTPRRRQPRHPAAPEDGPGTRKDHPRGRRGPHRGPPSTSTHSCGRTCRGLRGVKGTSWDELRSATTPGDYI
ncbi:SRPBCC family protein [Streptomyces sp. SAI-124]|uniref:SRPBCC family protein n=1 Tax=Streptomyces sp. SAI-124 TaxID=3377730 RepID=UPI003C7AEA06